MSGTSVMPMFSSVIINTIQQHPLMPSGKTWEKEHAVTANALWSLI